MTFCWIDVRVEKPPAIFGRGAKATSAFAIDREAQRASGPGGAKTSFSLTAG